MLLDFLQSIENDMGRVKVIDKGPRNIDLDILLYSKSSSDEMEFVDWHDDRLILPHALMYEREFVLRPLHEYVVPINIRLQLADASQYTAG
jgi:2-amino-4-hydroxy-6-hydroxymethyldihydropteridine diphosphokinase/dihydropteroate synthase